MKQACFAFLLLACLSIFPTAKADAFFQVVPQAFAETPKGSAFIPQLQRTQRPKLEFQINQLLLLEVQKDWEEYQLEIHRMTADGQLPLEYNQRNHFFSEYYVAYNGADVLSLTQKSYAIFDASPDLVKFHTMTLRYQNGQVLELKDLFIPQAAYRDRLEQWIRDDINRRSGSHWDFRGITNQKAFYLTPEGLVLYYEPCEISPASDGILRFVVPFDALKDILVPELALDN